MSDDTRNMLAAAIPALIWVLCTWYMLTHQAFALGVGR